MPIAPLQSIGMAGLNTDQPRESLDLQFWDTGLNMRSFEGALTGVPDFDTDVDTVRLFQNTTDGPDYPSNEVTIRPIEIAQWTAAGTDQVDLVTMGLNNSDSGVVYVVGGGNDPASIIDMVLPTTFEYDQQYGWQAFAFNEVVVINPTTAGPMYSFDRATFYPLPNWFGWRIGSSITTLTQYNVYKVTNVVDEDWSSVGGTTKMVDNQVFTATVDSADISALGTVKEMRPYFAKKMTTYNGRLVALNLFNDKNTVDESDDIYSPVELAYSSSVSDIGTILNLEWYASFRNTAGNAFLTQTPGRVVDALQLGEFLMVYKTDAVVRMQDTGEPLFVVGDTAFLDDGILSEGCVVDIGSNQHFVVGQFGMYIHTGGPDKDVVSNMKVEKFFYNDLPESLEDRGLTFVFHDSLDKEVWVCYRDSSENPSDTYKGCTRALVYNYVQGTWYLRSLPNVTSMVETEIEGAVRIFAASVDVAPNSSVTGTLYELDKDTLISDGYIQWTARSMGNPNEVKAIDGLYPTSADSFKIRMATSNTPTPPDIASVTPKTFDPDSAYKVDFRQLGRYYTMRWAMDDAIDPQISACLVDQRIEGGR